MKRTKILYWIFTGLMAAFMLMASIPDVLQIPNAVAIFKHLGYPTYVLPFIGIAKILGVISGPCSRLFETKGMGLRRVGL